MLHIIFFVDVFGITQRIYSLMKPFYSKSSFAGSNFEVFWCSFWGMLLYFWELSPILSYEILYRYFLYYCHSQSTKKKQKKIHSTYSSARFIMENFGSFLGILLNVLRNLKHYIDIWHECLDITVVLTKLRNVLGFPLLWTFLGVLGPFNTIFFK